ncbi:MAG: MFS transporter [Legionella sp.]|nr:MFS transporter [Legionella sp.]
MLDNHTPAFLSIFLISICYGNNSLLIRVLINQVDSPDSLNKRFAFLHVATNVAAMLGPLIFNILALYWNTILALEITSFTLVLSAIYSYLYLSTTVISKQENYFKNMRKLLTNKVLLKVYFLIIIAYFFYAQIFSLAPILLGHTYGLKAYVWVVGFLNSFISVIFSLKINEFFRRRTSIHSQIVSGFIFSILGFSSLLTIQSWVGVSMGVIFISLAEIAFIPGFQVILSNTTREDQKVAIFAINALCMGIGEGFGQYYGVLTSLGAINVYMIVIIYCMLSVGIYLSLSLERNCFFPSMVAK